MLLVALAWMTTNACAAGGHFEVDDATVMDPGQCQTEAWASRRSSAAPTTLLHLGFGCAVGPVELALSLDRVSMPGERQTWLGPQVKWVTETGVESLSIGAVGAFSIDVDRGGRPALSLYAPLTWVVSTALSVHLNVGVDRGADGTRAGRRGLSGEWAWNPRLALIGERARVGGEWVSRLGARWSVDESIGIDFSAARTGPQAQRVFTVVLNHALSR